MENTRAFIFFGQSGSGKGTQAKMLLKYLENENRKVIYIETGQKIREFIESSTHTANITKGVVSTGGLMPPFIPIWVWTDYLNDNFTGKEDLILDGLCRRPSEAPILDSALKFYKIKTAYIIVLNTSREWSLERLLARGRSDDNEEHIRSRLDWYERDVIPSLVFFKNNPDYVWLDISAQQSIDEVHKEIITKMKESESEK